MEGEGNLENKNEFTCPLTINQKNVKNIASQENLNLNKKFPNLLTNLNPINDFFFIEILKEGQIIDKKFLNKSRIVFGRAVDCDIVFEHPSISRYHAALYWKENSNNKTRDVNGFFYLIDLNSAHGTFLNKKKIESQKLIKLNPNQSQIKLGVSSRLLLFNVECNEEQDNNLEENFNDNNSSNKKIENQAGCMWGFKFDDYHIENDPNESESQFENVIQLLKEQSINSTENENVYLANPQKVVQQWFSNEGYDFEYKVEFENEKFKCTINLPIDGQEIPVSGTEDLKKKQSISNCCLRVCKVLDKAKILFAWQYSNKKKQNFDDYDNLDDNDLIDETGEIENKKLHLQKIKSSGLESLNSLNEKLEIINKNIDQFNKEVIVLSEIIKKSKETSSNEIEEDMDIYFEKMSKSNLSLSDCKINKSKIRMKLNQLNKDKLRIEKCIKIMNPVSSNKNNQKLKKNVNVTELIQKAQTKLQETCNKKNSVEQESKSNTLENKNVNLNNSLPKKDKQMFKVDTNLIDRKLKLQTNLFDSQIQKSDVKKSNLNKIIKNLNETSNQINTKPSNQTSKKIKIKSEFDDTYIEWLPPVDQTGDGMSELNKKYGY